MATDGGPQRPGESDRDYIRRLGRYAREQEQERRRGLRGDPRSQQNRFIRDNIEADIDLDQLIREGTGRSLDDVQRALDQDLAKAGADWDARDREVMREWKKVNKRRMMESKQARNRRVAKFAKKNKAQIDKIERKGKKKKGGCAVIAVMLLGATGGFGWAAYETGSAIVSALAH